MEELVRRDTDKIFVSVNKELMTNKNYRMDVVFNIGCKMKNFDIDKKVYYDTESNIRSYLKECSGITTPYKVKTIFKTLVDNNILTKREDGLYSFDAKRTPFISLTAANVRYLMNNLNHHCFKLYCYLLCKWQQHLSGNYKNYYRFSESELIEYMGYARKGENMLLLKEQLQTLQKVGLIKISEMKNFQGQRGKYRELYKVYTVSEAQLAAVKEEVEEKGLENISKNEKVLNTVIDVVTNAEPEQVAKVFNESVENLLSGQQKMMIEQINRCPDSFTVSSVYNTIEKFGGKIRVQESEIIHKSVEEAKVLIVTDIENQKF